MLRKVFRTGNSIVVSLPREALDYLGIEEGSKVRVELDREQRQLIVTPAPIVTPVHDELAEIDEAFALQVSEFIERYRPALTALAK